MVKGKSRIRKISDWLHLWLGISVGLLIVIISITGCIYVFERDIRDITETYRKVPVENKPYLPPSALKAIGEKRAGVKISGVQYGPPGEAVALTYTKKPQGFTYLYLNPYSGAILKEKILEDDFFRIVLAGHFYLWLPPKIGQPVVCIAVLIFIFLLISGIVMWWPKRWNKANRKKSFNIGRKASFKRLNYDLHNVLGFYVMLIAFVIAVTGSVFGFKWFQRSYYYTITGGTSMAVNKRPVSDSTLTRDTTQQQPVDIVWQQMMKEYNPIGATLQVGIPDKKPDPIAVTYNPDNRTYYKRVFRYFDQYTSKELAVKPRPDKAGDKIYRMNYDIHVGAAFGMTGKIIAFIASLICGSLPVTGFMIWYGRRKKAKRNQ
jgi:uncharacterized iron-regulated membrane protein